MLEEFWKTSKWLVVAFLALILFLSGVFGREFWTKTMDSIQDVDWWASNFVTFLVFTVIVGVVSWLMNVIREQQHRRPFEKWHLIIRWKDENFEQDLFWAEAERIQTSDFERWKLVKSVVSGVGNARLMSVHPAEEKGWVVMNDRDLVIDLNLACEVEHVVPHEQKESKTRTAHF